jgi:uncharacterized protein YwqG
MNIAEIKNRLAKRATQLSAGGFKPTYSDKESWIGRVAFYKEEESIPEDANGIPMLPLLQLSLEGLPYIPDGLENTRMITVFISEDLLIDGYPAASNDLPGGLSGRSLSAPNDLPTGLSGRSLSASNDLPTGLSANGNGWVLREYSKEDQLINKRLENLDNYIRSFPLKTTFIPEDYPVWDSGNIPSDIEDEILRLESTGEITDYYDIVENNYGHKLGGYPTFSQSGIDFGQDFEFLLQIASDGKANLEIVDAGTIFLAKNRKTAEWRLYIDFL